VTAALDRDADPTSARAGRPQAGNRGRLQHKRHGRGTEQVVDERPQPIGEKTRDPIGELVNVSGRLGLTSHPVSPHGGLRPVRLQVPHTTPGLVKVKEVCRALAISQAGFSRHWHTVFTETRDQQKKGAPRRVYDDELAEAVNAGGGTSGKAKAAVLLFRETMGRLGCARGTDTPPRRAPQYAPLQSRPCDLSAEKLAEGARPRRSAQAGSCAAEAVPGGPDGGE
jgi:hypothetical protein